ncbi:putative O-methyltransferase [Astrocystis sublimbata]|nr:putative O-methyltransferase [Astrocystis sublimbata]
MHDQKSATSKAIDVLIDQLVGLKGSIGTDPEASDEAISVSRKIVHHLEKPEKMALDMIYSPFTPIAARIAVEMNLFLYISQKNGPITSHELATLSGGEEELIVRILRVLVPMGLLDEVGEKTWEARPVTHAMASEGIAAGYRMVGEILMTGAQQSPKYLRNNGYRCPTDPRAGFIQYAFQTDLTTFELISTMPDTFRDFNSFMGREVGARKKWLEWYDVSGRLMHGAKQDVPLLVDVGGGKGHDLVRFLEFHPGAERLVLQDLEPVLQSAPNLPDKIEKMPYDIFTMQPIKGARAYFFHHVFHDWSDHKSLEILEHVVKSMSPGYSKLLIHEMIVPEKGAGIVHATLDMAMMCFGGGKERTAKQWEQLLEGAGLTISGIWPGPEASAAGIIEAMIAV